MVCHSPLKEMFQLYHTHRKTVRSCSCLTRTSEDIWQGTSLGKTGGNPVAIKGYAAALQCEHHLPPVSHLKHHVYRLRQCHLRAAKPLYATTLRAA